VLAKDKDDVDALTGMGRLLRDASLYRSSNDYYARALQRREVRADAGRREAILSSMGANYLEVKVGKRAADVFQRCLKEFPASPARAQWTRDLARARAIQSEGVGK
jgi:hypothetical protein